MLPRIIQAILIALSISSVGLAIVAWLGEDPHPFEHHVYQEFSTAKPEEGFEYVVGYTGIQTFYWEEILASKEFQLSVLKRRGEAPHNRTGLLPQSSAHRYIELDFPRKEGLYLMQSYSFQPEPAESFQNELKADYIPFAEAFIEATAARGVEVRPVGEIKFISRDRGSRWEIIRSYWLTISAIACLSSITTALVTRTREKKENEK
jgi:hypothetical protein